MRTFTLRLFLAASILPFAATLASANGHFFNQDFETDAAHITPRPLNPGDPSNLTRVSSGGGFLGVPSASGSNHLEIGFLSEDFSTAKGFGASWNDNPGAGTFESGLGTHVSVYLDDPNRQMDFGFGPENLYFAGDGWYFQPTLLNPAGDTPISGGGFGVQLDNSGNWVIAATGNANGGFEYGLHNAAHPQSGDTVFTGTPTFNGSEGWLTFETIWNANGTGGIDQVNTVYLSGVPVYGAIINNAVSDVSLAGTVGQAWLGQDGPVTSGETGYSGNQVPSSFMGEVAIDGVAVIPEPGTVAIFFGLFAAGVVGLRRRNRK